MNKKYCTVEDVENYVGLDVAAGFQSQIESWIEGISNLISLKTSREWLADTAANERFFDGNGMQSMEVDEFIEVSNVYTGDAFGENFTEETSYITYPHNTTVKDTIVLKDSLFPSFIKSVKINAKWGYAVTVPEDIKFATVVLVAGIILSQTNQDQEVKSEKIGNYSVSYETDAQKSDYENALQTILYRRKITI